MDSSLTELERQHATSPDDAQLAVRLARAWLRAGLRRMAWDLLVDTWTRVPEDAEVLLDEAMVELARAHPRTFEGRLQHAPIEKARLACIMIERAGEGQLLRSYAWKEGAPEASRALAARVLGLEQAPSFPPPPPPRRAPVPVPAVSPPSWRWVPVKVTERTKPAVAITLKLAARTLAVVCAYCKDDLRVEEERTLCAGCGTSLHLECRVELGRCPTLACPKRDHLGLRVNARVVTPARLSGVRRVLGALAAALGRGR